MYTRPTPLHTLRRSRTLAAAALSWCVLALAAAVFAPLWAAAPAAFDLHQVCSAAGAPGKGPAQTGTSGAPSDSSVAGGLHCVLCLGGAAPLATAPRPALAGHNSSPLPWAADTPASYSRHAGPAPARGPPAA